MTTNWPPEIQTDFIMIPSWVLLMIVFAIGLAIGALVMLLIIIIKRK